MADLTLTLEGERLRKDAQRLPAVKMCLSFISGHKFFFFFLICISHSQLEEYQKTHNSTIWELRHGLQWAGLELGFTSSCKSAFLLLRNEHKHV